ncbi:LexA family protein [Vreelandella aquamarina]|uniref:LexA family protein n=1 Tax=Vreelandella aquamarina TaxID=77097 RepID=UPI001D194C3B|nr:XRE family transcriptional regulator [Halomonas meridiana]MCC4288484.1 XRE family transcriptional regulator [Halomonas meridiana]
MKDRIRNRRRERGLSQDALAKRLNITKGTISQWEQGRTTPSGENLYNLARELGVTARWVLEGGDLGQDAANVEPSVEPVAIRTKLVPEISWVAAGAWAEVCHVESDPDALNWYPCPVSASESTFVLRVVGESMAPEYPPGRIIFIDPERQPESGDDVVASMTDTNEATFKRYIEEPGSGKMLKALNPDWKDPYIKINGNCRIVGVVIADMRIKH